METTTAVCSSFSCPNESISLWYLTVIPGWSCQ